MRTVDDDAEARVTLEQPPTSGKRPWGSLEDNETSSSSLPKIQKTSSSTCVRDSKPSTSQQDTNISTNPSAPRGITKANLSKLRDQLSALTLKNREIKTSIQTWRTTILDELFTHMRVRNIALSQLGRRDVDPEMRSLCIEGLKNRKNLMVAREDELLHLEKLLSGHAAVLEFADSAYEELVEKVKIFEDLAKTGQGPGLSMLDFPEMSKLARLTGGEPIDDEISTSERITEDEDDSPPPFSTFAKFSSLPTELRLSIWRFALPGPRVITHTPTHNTFLTLLSTTHESRTIALSASKKLLSIPPSFPQAATPVLFIVPAIDTVVRDLTLPASTLTTQDGGGTTTRSLFRLTDQDFNHAMFSKLTGLARIKNLALAFDLLHENGGVLFGAIQACCPFLKTLSLFPASQFRYRYRFIAPIGFTSPHQYELLTVDSNVLDYIYWRQSMLPTRKLKKKAQRGIDVMLTLANHAQQYMEVFPSYVATYGRSWRPFMRVCLLLHFNEGSQGWQAGPLDGDRYSKGHIGDDGRRYRGFVESLKLADKDGELFSRYDGMKELFRDSDVS